MPKSNSKTKKVTREAFIDEVSERIKDKNTREIAEGIVWAIETYIANDGLAAVPDPEETEETKG